MAEQAPVRFPVARGVLTGLLQSLPAMVVAVVTFQLIRTHLLERYLVPSASMEPTLHGDPTEGDLVLVDKTSYWRREPKPFDLVVVRSDHDPLASFLVKRAVVIGPAWLQIDQGDLFVGPTEQQLARVVKDPVARRDHLVPHYFFPNPNVEPELPVDRYFFERPSHWRADADGIELRAGAADLEGLARALTPSSRRRVQREDGAGAPPFGHLGTREAVTTSFLDCRGRRIGRDHVHPDIAVEIDATLGDDCTGIQLVLEHQGVCRSVGIGSDGGVELRRDGVTVQAYRATPEALPRRVTATFGHLDGMLFLVVDDALVFHRHEGIPANGLPPDGSIVSRRRNLLHVAAAGGTARLHRVAALHDLFHERREAPFRRQPPTFVESGQVYLLGDNTFDSRDSRTYGPFPLADVVGRPWLVLAPRERIRSLVP